MAVLDLIGRRAIAQGSRYELDIVVEGDFSAATWAGAIRSTYAGKTVLAAFSFTAPIYALETNTTSLTAYLPSAVTRAIPATAPDLRYQINATLPTLDPTRVRYGRVAISREVLVSG